MAKKQKIKYKREVHFYLDGEEITLKDESPKTLLVDYLHRPEVGKGGTKRSCGQGGCGACTVMLTSWNNSKEQLEHKAINSCLRPIVTLDGMSITTTQGLGNVKDGVDPVQWKIAHNNGSQCGYCTPGFTMRMYSALQKNGEMTTKEIEDLFDGNICRCTGYRPILDGFKQFACDYSPPADQPAIEVDPYYTPVPKEELTPPFKPSEKFLQYMQNPRPLRVREDGYTYRRPVNLQQLYAIMNKYGPVDGNFRLISGDTAKGIYPESPVYNEPVINQRHMVDVSFIPELQEVHYDEKGLTIGAQITISRLMDLLDELIGTLPDYKSSGLRAFKKHLDVVANEQVRNEASVAGNIYIGTNLGFLSDVVLCLATLGAKLLISDSTGSKEYEMLDIPVTKDLPKDAVYHRLHIPFSQEGEYFETYKIRKRYDDCHAIVNAGYRILLDADNCVKESFLVSNGIDAQISKYGAGFKPIVFHEATEAIAGAPWDAQTLQTALDHISQKVNHYAPEPDLQIDEVPFSYRATLTNSLFYKCFVAIAEQINPGGVPPGILSAGQDLPDPESKGEQHYNSYDEEEPVSAPYIKLGAFMQATGEARYSTDVDRPVNTVEASFVYSLVANGQYSFTTPDGKKTTADGLAAYLKGQFPEFVELVTYEDIPEANRAYNWVGLGADDPIFVPAQGVEIPQSIADAAEASNGFFEPRNLTSVGAPIGLVIAKTQSASREISVFVRNQCIHFESETPLDFETSFERRHYFPQSPSTMPSLTHIEHITRPGSNEEILSEMHCAIENLNSDDDIFCGDNLTAGVHDTGYQNHFYMETMVCLAVPGENKSMELYASTQNAADNQSVAAKILGIHTSSVRVTLQREGGGFGGKQTRSRFTSTAAVIAAWKLSRPVRLKIDRNTNFIMCGNRHPFRAHYATKHNGEGKIKAMHIDYVSNGGNTYDMSFPVMDLAVLSADNVYNIDTFKVTGNVCQTNQISSTAFRTFGLVQGFNILEEIIEHTAFNMGIAPEELRERNFYKDGMVDWSSFTITQPDPGNTSKQYLWLR